MHKFLAVGILVCTLVPYGFASAQTSAPAAPTDVPTPAPPAPSAGHVYAGNLTLATDYRFRGISQTYGLPAVQGGFDYSNANGFYLGTWMSNVSGNQYPNGDRLEWDQYGGYKSNIAGNLAYDAGLLNYYYPGAHYNNPMQTRFNNLELYGALSWKWIVLKYSHTLSDYFGTNSATFGGACENAHTGNPANCFAPAPGSSKGSGYTDLSYAYEFAGKTTLVAHIGHQSVRHYNALGYSDYKLGVTREYAGLLIGAALVGTDARKGFYTVVEPGNPGSFKVVSKDSVVLTIGRTF